MGRSRGISRMLPRPDRVLLAGQQSAARNVPKKARYSGQTRERSCDWLLMSLWEEMPAQLRSRPQATRRANSFLGKVETRLRCSQQELDA